jgi:hypothetical protein
MDDKSVSQDNPRPTLSRDQTGPGPSTPTQGCSSAMGGCEVAIAEPWRVDQPGCSAYADLLVDLSDGELPLDQQETVRQHVASCPGCQAELGRLDASLVRLTRAIVSPAKVVSRPSQHLNRRVGLALAATSLTCLLALCWFAWRSATNSVAKLPDIKVHSPPLLTPADALRQIALAEQCARLQTSLNLLPDDPTYADQRATNERLLVKFQQAAADAAPRTNNGEAL